MNQHHYHPVTKEYISTTAVELDPVGGNPMVPAHATLTEPLENIAENQTQTFINGEWVVITDHRGYVGFDANGVKQNITEIGIEPDANWTVEPPPPTEAELTAAAQTALMALCDDKQDKAFHYVLKHRATSAQIKRYENKYTRAKAGEFSAAKNKAIIEKHEAAQAAIETFVDMIEAFREFVDDLIDAGELDKANAAIKAGAAFDETTTRADIDALLGRL